MSALAAGLFALSVVLTTSIRASSGRDHSRNPRAFNRSSAAPDHIVLSPPLAPNERVFIIGDVHGCFVELLELVKKAEAMLDKTKSPPETLRVITVGDLVNKGPHSAQVVELVRAKRWGSVMGNHDAAIVKLLANPAPATAADVAATATATATATGAGAGKGWVSMLSPQEKQWLCDLPYTISIPQLRCVVVHAGLVPGVPLYQQDTGDMMCMRNIVRSAHRGMGMQAGMSHVSDTWRSTGAAAAEGNEEEEEGGPCAWAQVWGRHMSGGDGEGDQESTDAALATAAASTTTDAVVRTDRNLDVSQYHVVFGHDAKRGLQQRRVL